MSEQAINIKFVQMVQKHPCLYNYDLTDYSRKDITEAAWNEVGKIMKMTGAACKEKWKNLRSVFVRNMKPLPSGSKRKKYYLNDSMKFLLPYVKSSYSSVSSNVLNDSQEQVTLSDFLMEISPTTKDIEENCNQETSDVELSQSHTISEPSQPVECKRRKQFLNEVDTSLTQYFNKERHHNVRSCNYESRKYFLLSLLDEVNLMTHEQMRLFKRKVLTLIDEITTPSTVYQTEVHQTVESYLPANSPCSSHSTFAPANYQETYPEHQLNSDIKTENPNI